jgi:hypothetical protein
MESGNRCRCPPPHRKLSRTRLFEARERVRGRCIDGGRPARHWTAVKLEIARRQGIVIGLAGADLRG